MKLLIKSACVAFVLTVLYSFVPFQADCQKIANEVFRLHILANSDSEADQALKLKVRDKVLDYSQTLFASVKTKEEAERLAAQHLDIVQEVAQEEVKKCGYSYPVSAEITKMHFDTRYYEDFTLPAGQYDALRLTIGRGEGHNWWCVMFPSLCISSPESRDDKAREALTDSEYEIVKSDEREYRFFIVELFEKIFGTG